MRHQNPAALAPRLIPALLGGVLLAASCASRPRVPEWKGVSKRVRPEAAQPAIVPVERSAPARRTALAAGQALRAELARTMIPSLHITDEESLRAVLEPVRNITGLPIVVDTAAENAALDAGVLFNFQLDHPISVQNFLNLVARQASGDVAWVVRHDAVLLSTPERTAEPPVLVSHDVRDILFARTDFQGPRIDRLRLLDDLEDEDGGGPFGGVGETVQSFEPGDLVTLVEENVAVGTWGVGRHRVESENGFLIVVHEPAVQVQVRRFLDQLR